MLELPAPITVEAIDLVDRLVRRLDEVEASAAVLEELFGPVLVRTLLDDVHDARHVAGQLREVFR